MSWRLVQQSGRDFDRGARDRQRWSFQGPKGSTQDSRLAGREPSGHSDPGCRSRDLPREIWQIVENRNRRLPARPRRRNMDPRSCHGECERTLSNPSNLTIGLPLPGSRCTRSASTGYGKRSWIPGSRIRLNSEDGEFEPEEHMELVSLGWEGGFLDGASVRLNPESERSHWRARYGQVHRYREYSHRAWPCTNRRGSPQGT